MEKRGNPLPNVLMGLVGGALAVFAIAALSNSGRGNTTPLVVFGYVALVGTSLTTLVAAATGNHRTRNLACAASVLLAPLVLLGQVSCCLD